MTAVPLEQPIRVGSGPAAFGGTGWNAVRPLLVKSAAEADIKGAATIDSFAPNLRLSSVDSVYLEADIRPRLYRRGAMSEMGWRTLVLIVRLTANAARLRGVILQPDN